jgi:hypothetical protein
VPGKVFWKFSRHHYEQKATLWWSFSGAAKKNTTRPRPEEKMEPSKMKFTGTMLTGTLIEDLMARVERAEQRTQSDETSTCEPILIAPRLAESSAVESFSAESSSVEPWLTSLPQDADYDSKFIGVA